MCIDIAKKCEVDKGLFVIQALVSLARRGVVDPVDESCRRFNTNLGADDDDDVDEVVVAAVMGATTTSTAGSKVDDSEHGGADG